MLKDKLNSTNSRFFEHKNSMAKLKSDLKLTQKLLQDEVGENYEQIVGNSSWKGRAQTITELQVKNNELRDKLKYYSCKVYVLM